MNKRRIVIVGASGHGRVAMDAARVAGQYEVVGFVDTFVPTGTVMANLTVLGRPDDLPSLAREHHVEGFFLGISDNWTRAEVHARIRERCPDMELVSFIHPSAVVAPDVTVGAGSLILAGAVVNTGSRLGMGCIVNTQASLDHDSEMKPWSSLLPAATTGGGVSIGEYSCICLGARIVHRINIGDHCMIGAGAVVLDSIPPFSLAYGIPARVIRARKAGERHF